jgi:hypothetical protein
MEWIAALDKVEALKPSVVIAGQSPAYVRWKFADS